MSCLGGILGWFWSFVKNFFEGHTSPPPRSAFAPPAPLCNEPGCFDRFANLLCVNLLQHWYTCFCVATSVKISVFGVHFWRGCFVYILRKWIFYFTAFRFISSKFVAYLFLLTRWLTCHIICACRFGNLPRWLRLQLEVLQLEVSKIWKLTTLWSCEVILRLKILQLLGCPSTTARRGC